MKTIAILGAGFWLAACSGSSPDASAPSTELDEPTPDGGDGGGAPSTIPDPVTGGCGVTGNPDAIDASGVDDNCDGIDGVLTDTVFVRPGAPLDAAGTGTAPVGSLAKGIAIAQAAGKHHVYACVGTLPEAAIALDGVSDLHLHGGFRCEDWQRTDASTRTQWASTSAEALRITGASQVSFERFDLSAAAAVEPGASSVAVAVVASAGVTFSDAKLQAGNGAAGAEGTAVAAADPRERGAAGRNGGSPTLDLPAVPQPCAEGGFAGSGGAAAARFRQAGDAGGNSSEGVLGGSWTRSGGLDQLSSANATGSDGAAGTPGAAGAAAAALGMINAGRYVPTVGAAGTAGSNGQSGGGGAPGQSVQVCKGHAATIPPGTIGYPWACDEAPFLRIGGGGGAGGCYGVGGGAGQGAQSGGASIALLLDDSTVQLAHIVLVTGAGGRGGAAGAGAPGQTGGQGGAGGSGSFWNPIDEVRTQNAQHKNGDNGFPGGHGGDGGAGGSGGAGAGGPSVGIFAKGGPIPTGDVTTQLGTGGAGGAGHGGPDGAVGIASATQL